MQYLQDYFCLCEPRFRGRRKNIRMSCVDHLRIAIYSIQGASSVGRLDNAGRFIYGSFNMGLVTGHSQRRGIWFKCIRLLFCFAIGFFIASNFSKQEALDANEKLVIGTLLIGLPIYFVVLFGLLPVSSFAEYNYGRWTHRTIFVTNFLLVDGYLSTRFVGFGSEPGLSQIFFLLALVNRLRRKK